MAQEGVRGYRVTARAVDDVALDSPEVGHRTEGLPGAGREGSRGLEERGDAVAFVPAARRRDGAAGGVAPDPADCEPLNRQRLTTKLTTRGATEEKAPQRKSLQSLIFTQSGRRDLNPRPPEPHSGALPGCATSRSFTSRRYHAALASFTCNHLRLSRMLFKPHGPSARRQVAPSPKLQVQGQSVRKLAGPRPRVNAGHSA